MITGIPNNPEQVVGQTDQIAEWTLLLSGEHRNGGGGIVCNPLLSVPVLVGRQVLDLTLVHA